MKSTKPSKSRGPHNGRRRHAERVLPLRRRPEVDRTRRVGNLLRGEMAALIAAESSVPELALVTVTGVDLSKDLRFATFHISKAAVLHGDDDGSAALVAACAELERRKPQLRHRLSRGLDLRVTPALRFVPDHTPAHGARLSRLIAEAGDES